MSNAKMALSDDSYRIDDKAGYATADSLSLDNILGDGMDDTLSIDYLVEAEAASESLCLDSIVQANKESDRKGKKPPEIILNGISTMDPQPPLAAGAAEAMVVNGDIGMTPAANDTSLYVSANTTSNTYYTPNASGVQPLDFMESGLKTPDSLDDTGTYTDSRSRGSRGGGLSEDTLSDYSDQKSLGSLRADPSPSPNRLIDAKRKFFFEMSQPLRIDPQSIFKDIPRPSDRSGPTSERRRSRDVKAASEKAGMELLGLKRDWKKVENSTPTSPTAAIPHRNSVSGEKDMFYAQATTAKSRQDDAGTSTAKKRLLSSSSSSKQGPNKKGITASEIKSDDERLHEKNKQKRPLSSKESKTIIRRKEPVVKAQAANVGQE